jgi:hypothetical protein
LFILLFTMDAIKQLILVIPGLAKREPGIHNHDGEYGFPDVQLHI